MADDSQFWANLRRSGNLGTGQKEFQGVEDRAGDKPAAYPFSYTYHKKPENILHKIVEESHQEHKAVTGQAPDPEDQGYTTYKRKSPYTPPSEE